MNHQYRVIWNATTQSLQAVAETAKAQGKGHSSVSASGSAAAACSHATTPTPALTTLVLAIAFVWLASVPNAWAGPQGGTVTAGSATITASGTTTTINQRSNKAAIDWTSFSVGKSESVRFNQPTASSITLNRVTGTESSQILGSLSANGQVFILNPNGLLVGNGAQINTGGFMASTLGMTNDDFMAGRYKLTSAPGMAANASVTNAGNINVADGGSIVLIAPLVSNTGTLNAPNGSVLLAAANAVTLTLQDNQRLSYTLDQGSLQAMVDNGGLIQGAGGHVILTAKGRDALTKATVNHSGLIEAQTVQDKGGVVELLADMAGGQVKLSGRIDASAPNGGNGGFVETSAASVKVADSARVSTLAATGKSGTWLIDPPDFNIGGANSDMSASTLSTNLDGGDVQIISSTGTHVTAGNGDINVNDAVTWSAHQLKLTAQNNININANLNGGAAGKLALEYGQALPFSPVNTADYFINNGSNITLSAGANFSTKLGSDGVTKAYTVITALGNAGSTTTTDLQGINGDVTRNYALGANIDATATSSWNGTAGWTPLGTPTSPFAGTLAGLGHRVSGLNTSPIFGSGHSGFINRNTGTVRDIGLVDIHVTGFDGPSFTGAITGYNFGKIFNSYSTGSVGGFVYVGGLVGYNLGSITNSYSMVNVSGDSVLGGLVAYNGGSISSSYATGIVAGTGNDVGGLVGGNVGSIANSYSAGAVSGIGAVGGLIGSTFGSTTVTNSFWDKQTSTQAASAGGTGATGLTTAQMQQSSTFAGSSAEDKAPWLIYDGHTYPLLRGFLKPLTLTAEYDGSQSSMGGIAAYTASATVNGSQLLGTGRLVLASNGTAGQKTASIGGYYSTQQGYDISAAPRTITGGSNAANDVNVDSPLSWTSGQLVLRAQSNININANLNGGAAGKLALAYGQGAVAAGNLSDYYVNNGSNVSLPAGANFRTQLGNNDGSTTQYTVVTALGSAGSMTTTDLQGINGGLAGNYALGADIDASATAGWNAGTGWTPLGASTTGNRFSGTFAGLGHRVSNLTTVSDFALSNRDAGFFGDTNGTVRDTGVVDVNVTGQGDATYSGGIAGGNGGTISNSYATGFVSGTSYTGGLVGANGGTISNSYSTGHVSGTLYTGGLVGVNDGTISNSYATGAVTGTDAVGGLVGYSGGTIDSSYSTGSVTGITNVGGLLGNNVNGTVTNSYWDTTTSGQSSSAGGSGLSTAQMKQASSFVGWDMASSGGSTAVWRIYEGQAAPLLRSFLKPLTVTANSGSKTYNGTAEALGRSFSTTPDMSQVLGIFTNATTSKDVGTHGVSVSGLYSAQQGYDITAVGGTVTINPRPITVNAAAQSKVYGNTNPALTYTVAADGVGTSRGLVNNDTLSGALSTNATTTSGITTLVTSYAIDASGLANGNYVITANNGVLTINPRPLTVTADAKSKTYGDTNPLLTYSVIADGVGTSRGLVNSDTLSGALSTTATNTSGITTSSNSYAIDASALANGNYVITANNGVLTINPRPLTVIADAKSKTYGDANPALTYTLAADGVGTSRGLVNNDTLSGSLSTNATSTSSISTASNSYSIDASALANGNYVITANNGVIAINPKAITVNADPQSKAFGSADPALTWQLASGSSLVGSDSLAGALARAAGEDTGSYAIGRGTLGNSNYDITFKGDALMISAASALPYPWVTLPFVYAPDFFTGGGPLQPLPDGYILNSGGATLEIEGTGILMPPPDQQLSAL